MPQSPEDLRFVTDYPEDLHALGGGDPEEVETGDEDLEGHPAQGQPGGARGVVGLEHGAALVEDREGLGQLEEVGAQPVRLERVSDLDDDVAEPEQPQGEIMLAGLLDDDRARWVVP